MLWTMKKTGTPLNVLINSNIGIVEGRMIRQGDKIAVRVAPLQKASISRISRH